MELTIMTNEGQMTMNWNITYKNVMTLNSFKNNFTCVTNLGDHKFKTKIFFNKPPKKAHP